MAIKVGEGIRHRMEEQEDHPIMDPQFGVNSNGSQWERCWGTRGLYIASNASGDWETLGPFGLKPATPPPQAVSKFEPATPPVRQSGPWQCSAAATAWVLRSLGRDVDQDDVVAKLGPHCISPDVGLHDGSGAALARVLTEMGLTARHAWVRFEDVLARAGQGPVAMGGAHWYHWTGVRGRDGDTLLLANPAPGWKGIQQTMTRQQFETLGPFAAVWVEV